MTLTVEQLQSESEIFRAALEGSSPDVAVPTCPDWTGEDLLWHLTEVQGFWARIVDTPITAEEQLAALSEPQRPATRAGLLNAAEQSTNALVLALRATAAEDQRWMWTADDALHTAGYILRRQVHEALIHRVDAELTAGQPVSPIASELAADGVDEMLVVMMSGHPTWSTFVPGGVVIEIRTTDADRSWLAELGRLGGTHPSSGESFEEASLRVVHTDEPVASVAGPAAALDLWLWNRGPDSDLQYTGDSAALQNFTEAIREGVQ